MKSKITILILAIFFAACGSTKLLIPSQVDADRAAQKNASITLLSINEGKVLFEQNCAKCHGYKNPNTRSEEKWAKIIPRMVAKVNKKMKKEEIDAKEQELILNYVVTMSSVKPVK
jgi:cytochrome c5